MRVGWVSGVLEVCSTPVHRLEEVLECFLCYFALCDGRCFRSCAGGHISPKSRAQGMKCPRDFGGWGHDSGSLKVADVHQSIR